MFVAPIHRVRCFSRRIACPARPYQAPKQDIEVYKTAPGDEHRHTYAAMITELDAQVGQIVAALKQKDMLDNTLIIFSSDNGGARSPFTTGRGPGRTRGKRRRRTRRKDAGLEWRSSGGKGSLHEGGMRIPTIFYWPGKLEPKMVDEPLDMVDVMPTVLALAGAKGSPDHPFDGKDVWTTLASGSRLLMTIS